MKGFKKKDTLEGCINKYVYGEKQQIENGGEIDREEGRQTNGEEEGKVKIFILRIVEREVQRERDDGEEKRKFIM